MPKTLIVPVDGSTLAERALPVANLLAQRLDSCEIVVVAVDVAAADRHRDYVESLVARFGGGTVTVRSECHSGDPAGVVARLSQREPDAAVCMTTHVRGRFAAPLLGSVATEVLRAVDVPVLLLGPKCDDDWWHEPPHLVACWAGSDSDAILDPACAWSDALGMDLSLLCVFHPLDVPASVDPDSQFAPALARLDPAHRGVRTIALRDDLPAMAIAEEARSLPATVVALTTRAREGVDRMVLGSVALDVVRQSPCPVLAVRRSR
jgi:nucleotide-binding universal stress UspA family protein